MVDAQLCADKHETCSSDESCGGEGLGESEAEGRLEPLDGDTSYCIASDEDFAKFCADAFGSGGASGDVSEGMAEPAKSNRSVSKLGDSSEIDVQGIVGHAKAMLRVFNRRRKELKKGCKIGERLSCLTNELETFRKAHEAGALRALVVPAEYENRAQLHKLVFDEDHRDEDGNTILYAVKYLQKCFANFHADCKCSQNLCRCFRRLLDKDLVYTREVYVTGYFPQSCKQSSSDRYIRVPSKDKGLRKFAGRLHNKKGEEVKPKESLENIKVAIIKYGYSDDIKTVLLFHGVPGTTMTPEEGSSGSSDSSDSSGSDSSGSSGSGSDSSDSGEGSDSCGSPSSNSTGSGKRQHGGAGRSAGSSKKARQAALGAAEALCAGDLTRAELLRLVPTIAAAWPKNPIDGLLGAFPDKFERSEDDRIRLRSSPQAVGPANTDKVASHTAVLHEAKAAVRSANNCEVISSKNAEATAAAAGLVDEAQIMQSYCKIAAIDRTDSHGLT